MSRKSLREIARGQPCYGRLPGCTNDPATVVLAHIRRGNIAGIGEKPADIAALPLCAACHDVFDGRVMIPNYPRREIDADILRGLAQWLSYLWRNELVTHVYKGN